ncbi:C40 family peptidase [Halomonas elongata]|uniref:C40 family peptidase n=1 Tax=Halomonas elongata TaxID=2746 RepID=UPI0038D37387
MPPRLACHRHVTPLISKWLLATLLLSWLAGCAGPDLATRDDGNLSMERTMILAEARQTLGTPYRFGGDTPSGLDCSGLVQLAYARAGIKVPRTSRRQFENLPPIDKARPGDLLFFDTAGRGDASHVGIYLGHGQMIHAPGRGRRVTTSAVNLDYWRERFLGAAAPAP